MYFEGKRFLYYRACKASNYSNYYGLYEGVQLWFWTVSSGKIEIKKDLDDSIEGLDVIVVEDIVDSGHTLSQLIPELKKRNPRSLAVTTLLDKPSRREVEVDVDYIGFEIEDKFVVGYGLDYDQSYRDLPFIGVVELED